MLEKIKKFFSNRENQIIVGLGRSGKGKSKSLIYAFFEPLRDRKDISEKEFEQIITSDKTNSETYLVDLFGEERANEIKLSMQLVFFCKEN